MQGSEAFDELEFLQASDRENRLFADFAARLKQAVALCPGIEQHLHDVDPDQIIDRTSLTGLPVLRKSELMQAQKERPPFGGFVPEQALAGQRMFMSPGPVFEPQLPGADPWQGARALFAAGIRAGDRVHNAFSYHLTPGGFILDEAARALGCVVFPAGAGNTESQLAAIRQLQPTVYTGTPDYLQTLLDAGREDSDGQGLPPASFKRALVSGGALFPAMRERYNEQGIHVQQCYATADIGVIAYETATDDEINPGMIVNENLIVELLIPGTGLPVTPGEVGELVVTRLHPDYPLIRFATGDLSAQLLEPSPCGRTGMRIKGWMGRADQRAKVRGMFVDPLQLALVGKNHTPIDRWRLIISRVDDQDTMVLQVTLSEAGSEIPASQPGHPDHDQWLSSVANSLQKATNLKGEVQVVDALPDDGTIVDDQRDYESG